MKKMSFFKWLFCSTLFAALAAVTGCTNDKSDEVTIPSLEVSESKITFDENGGAKTFDITTPAKWSITGAEGATWLAVTPALVGEGNQQITLTVGQDSESHTVTLKVKAYAMIYGVEKEVASKDVVVSQSPGGETPSDEIIFNETVGTGDTTNKPLVADWTGWTKSGTGASTVTYAGSGVSIRGTGMNNTNAYPGASGPNSLFFGTSASFTVKQITLTEAQTKLKLTFGGNYSYKPDGATEFDNVFPVDKFHVSLSADGVSWSNPIEYTKNDGDTKSPYWVLCTSNFTLKDPTTSLYIKFAADVNSRIRLDDITLTEGIGGQEVTLGGGVAPDPDTVTPINDIKAGAVYTAEGVIVAASTKSFLVQDNSGTMLVYMGEAPANGIGDKVKVKGTTSLYGGLVQFALDGTTPPLVTKTGTQTVTQPAPTVLEGAAMDAYLNNVKVQYIQYTGVLTISAPYYNVAVDGATLQGSLSYPDPSVVPDSYNGATVIVTGYAAGTASNNKYLTTIVTDVQLAAGQDGPAIVSLTPSALAIPAEGGDGPIQVVLRNADGCTLRLTPSAPFTAAANADNSVITVTAPNNATGGVITGSLKVELLKADQTVAATKTVTLTQAVPISPDATVIETNFRLAGTYPAGFPTKTGTAAAAPTPFSFGGSQYNLYASGSYYYHGNNTALFFGKTNSKFANSAYLEFPIVDGKKLVRVELTMGKGGGKGIALNIYGSNGMAAGGADYITLTGSPSGGTPTEYSHTFDVNGEVNVPYRLTSTTNDKNLQIAALKLYYQ